MKELSIEQKAKRYDEAIERAKEWYNNPNSSSIGKSYLYAVFPELQESEDERILEIIKHCIESRYLHTSTIKGISQKQCFAWLEKQGEKHIDRELSNLLNRVICRFINDPNIPYSERDEVSKKIIPYVEQLEKQGKQEEPQVYETEDGGSDVAERGDILRLYDGKYKKLL